MLLSSCLLLFDSETVMFLFLNPSTALLSLFSSYLSVIMLCNMLIGRLHMPWLYLQHLDWLSISF